MRDDPQPSFRRLTRIAAEALRPPAETPARWLALTVILVLAGGYWAASYQPYILPNSDFFRIKLMAEELMAARLPSDFKQMPLVPLLIGPLAMLLPVTENAYLHAISVLNIVLSLGSLALLYLLSRAFLGSTLALVPVLLLLAAPQFTVSAHQPMLEPAIGFFSLATLVALVHRPRWAYVFAGLCALTRYELAALLPAVFVAETWRTPRQWLPIGVKCTLAGLPFVVWFGASLTVPDQGNPYLEEMVRASFGQVLWNMQSPFPARTLLSGFIALAWTVGLYGALRRNAPVTLAMVVFFVLYVLAHFAYGRPLTRYSYAVLWVLPLLGTVAMHVVFAGLRPVVERVGVRVSIIAGAATAGVAVLFVLRATRTFEREFPDAAIASPSSYLSWHALWLTLAAAAVFVATRTPVRHRALAALATVVALSIPMLQGAATLAGRLAGVHYEKAELVVASAWLAHHLDNDTPVVMPRHHDLSDHMPNIDPDRVVRFSAFGAEDHGEFIRELDARGIAYVVFVHRPERPADPDDPLYARNVAAYFNDRIFLMEPFRRGGDVEGFELIATLPPTHPGENRPVHVYRRTPMLPVPEVNSDD